MENKKKFLFIIFIFFITGFITSIQFKQEIGRTDIITMKNIYEEQQNLENIKVEMEKLNDTIEELEKKVENYSNTDYNAEDIILSLEDELRKSRIITGQKDLQGPGIRIHMQDSEKYVEGQNINNFIIHNSDVLQIINDLRAAKAERIAINGTQVHWESEIDCNGATIKVDEEIYAPPFIIEAIGNPTQLEAALNAPDSIIQLMKIWNIQIYIQKLDNIVIQGREDIPDYEYLKIVEEGEK